MYQIRDEIEAFAAKRAAEDGLDCAFSYEDIFPDTTNTPEQAKKVLAAAQSLGLPNFLMPEITRGSEDFGWFLKDCSGAEFVVSGGDGPSLHTAGFDFDDRLIEVISDVYLAILRQ